MCLGTDIRAAMRRSSRIEPAAAHDSTKTPVRRTYMELLEVRSLRGFTPERQRRAIKYGSELISDDRRERVPITVGYSISCHVRQKTKGNLPRRIKVGNSFA